MCRFIALRCTTGCATGSLSAAHDGAPLDEYLRLREFPGLTADAAWLDAYWDVPEDVIEAHVTPGSTGSRPTAGAQCPSSRPSISSESWAADVVERDRKRPRPR